MSILYALLWFAGLSLILGLMLAAASVIFSVKVDPRIPQVLECLPGANCGGCGFTGCSACAEAIVKGEAKISACPVGGQKSADKIAAVMGEDAGTVTRMRAQVMCSGASDTAKAKYNYEGPRDCAAAMRLGGGPKTCPNGCIGFGTCAVVCPNDAITVVNGVATVNYTRCVGCGICVDSCPKNIIKLVPYDSKVWVGCSSPDKGALTRTYCDAGCLGCKLCEKTCEHGAIKVTGSLAAVNYDLCTGCGACAEKCRRNIIKIADNGRAVITGEPSEHKA
ncbi:MAG: RnfABCDGE type electron transport complex subunit B [Clostridia bacterium]|nr:RnfABCDGE type electron transport complex subunit B [Clostridia bacterium]